MMHTNIYREMPNTTAQHLVEDTSSSQTLFDADCDLRTSTLDTCVVPHIYLVLGDRSLLVAGPQLLWNSLAVELHQPLHTLKQDSVDGF